MDISAVRAGASLASGSPQPASRPGAASTDTFASFLGEASGARATGLEAAEALVGTRISPPPGGCGCDALVAAVSPDGGRPDLRDVASPTATPSPTPLRAGQRPSVTPGDVLVLGPAGTPSGRPHLAIARSISEMIAANAMGIVEIMPIPWERLLATQPLHE